MGLFLGAQCIGVFCVLLLVWYTEKRNFSVSFESIRWNAQKVKRALLRLDDPTKRECTVFCPLTMTWKEYLFLLLGLGVTRK